MFSRPFLRGLYSEGGGAEGYIGREICVTKSVRLILGGKFAWVSVVYAYFTTSKYIWLFTLLAVISVVISSVFQLII